MKYIVMDRKGYDHYQRVSDALHASVNELMHHTPTDFKTTLNSAWERICVKIAEQLSCSVSFKDDGTAIFDFTFTMEVLSGASVPQ